MKVNIELKQFDRLQSELTKAAFALQGFKLAVEEINKIELEMKTTVEGEEVSS